MRTRVIIIMLIAFAKFSSYAQTGLYVPQLAAFDAAMTNLLSTYNVPGGQMALTYHGRLVYNRGFGYADVAAQTLVQPNSLFRIASVSKPITGVAIMKLFEQGQINLDAKVFGATGILNDAIYQNILDPLATDITVRQLLHHEGGWDSNLSGDPMFDSYNIATVMGVTPPASSVDVVRYMLANKMLDFTPGTQSVYSNFGFCVLGRVIEKITGQTYTDYVTTNVLNPAGIYDMQQGHNLLSGQIPNEVQYYDYPGAPSAYSVYNNISTVPWQYGGFNLEAMDAHGGWIASCEDLCKFLVAIDRFTTKPDILLPATIDTFIKPGVDPNYACGINVNTNNNWWHLGSLPGTCAEIIRAGNQQVNWVILVNSRTANSGTIFNTIDNMLWSNLGSVSNWPTNDLFTGINENELDHLITVFPNPSNLDVTIESPAKFKSFSIIDVTGKVIYNSDVNDDHVKISVENYDDGIYFVRVTNEDHSAIQKLIVQHK
ncbi:MAG: serine hydrolase [Bacteroidota bacterium]